MNNYNFQKYRHGINNLDKCVSTEIIKVIFIFIIYITYF
jgi:hypothetical protein